MVILIVELFSPNIINLMQQVHSFLSPFEQAAIFTVDGVGEWASSSIGVGDKNKISLMYQQNFLILWAFLYAAFTAYCGFRVNSGSTK